MHGQCFILKKKATNFKICYNFSILNFTKQILIFLPLPRGYFFFANFGWKITMIIENDFFNAPTRTPKFILNTF